jgi:hypothetical protein
MYKTQNRCNSRADLCELWTICPEQAGAEALNRKPTPAPLDSLSGFSPTSKLSFGFRSPEIARFFC